MSRYYKTSPCSMFHILLFGVNLLFVNVMVYSLYVPQQQQRRSSRDMTMFSSSTTNFFEVATTITNAEEDQSQGNLILPNDKNQGQHMIFPGGGIFFYWQAGVVCFLREQGYDLSDCSFSGASAGALTATLTATNVNFYDATDLALSLAADGGVWDRSGGLQGIWGPMIDEWLDTLLPNSIEEHTTSERLSLLVTPIPSFGTTSVSEFKNRRDLIHCNMASVHLPWFLDGKLTSDFRNKPHIDGSFLSKATDYLPNTAKKSKRRILTIDFKDDPLLQSRKGFDIVEALSPDGIWGLLEQGKRFAIQMEEQGQFEYLKKK